MRALHAMESSRMGEQAAGQQIQILIFAE